MREIEREVGIERDLGGRVGKELQQNSTPKNAKKGIGTLVREKDMYILKEMKIVRDNGGNNKSRCNNGKRLKELLRVRKIMVWRTKKEGQTISQDRYRAHS